MSENRKCQVLIVGAGPGGYVAAKALDTFGQLAGNFITKKYGQGETEVEQK